MSSQTEQKTVPTIGKLIDKVFTLRHKKADLEASVKDVEGKIADLNSEIMELMQAAGMERTSTKMGTCSLNSTTVAQVEDWDKFLAYIYKNKFGHLLQRRVSDPAWRELIEQGKKVPGTQPFIKKSLGYRAAS